MIILDENYVVLDEDILDESYKLIKSTSDIDASKSNVTSDLEKYKELLNSGNYRVFKSSDKPLLELTLKSKEFLKIYATSFLASIGIAAGAGYMIGKHTEKKINKMSSDASNQPFVNNLAILNNANRQIAKGRNMAKVVGTASGISGSLLAKYKTGKINISYTVFKYKGMNVIAIQPKDNITETKKVLKNCYSVLVKTGKQDRIILKKLKNIVPKEV